MPHIASLSYMWLVVVVATWAENEFPPLRTHWSDGYDAMRGLILEILSIVSRELNRPGYAAMSFTRLRPSSFFSPLVRLRSRGNSRLSYKYT
jgi:hypothetical protein